MEYISSSSESESETDNVNENIDFSDGKKYKYDFNDHISPGSTKAYFFRAIAVCLCILIFFSIFGLKGCGTNGTPSIFRILYIICFGY